MIAVAPGMFGRPLGCEVCGKSKPSYGKGTAMLASVRGEGRAVHCGKGIWHLDRTVKKRVKRVVRH